MENEDIARLIPLGARINQPLYIYQAPMFMVTASVVVFVENAAIVLRGEDGEYRFPGGPVKAGIESVQFAAIRYLKEQTGVAIKKSAIYPVDFRSSPERSHEGNVLDIGMMVMSEGLSLDDLSMKSVKWIPVDFENRVPIDDVKMFMDHDTLLSRAVDVLLMMK